MRVLPSLEDLVAELEDVRPFKTGDSLSGSRFDAARYRGEPVVVKYMCLDDDWIMRAIGDIDCHVLRFFDSDVESRLPDTIDHAVIAVAPYASQHGHRSAALMLRDVGPLLIPSGESTVSLDTHTRFIEHMADLHAALWEWQDAIGLIPLAHHYTSLTPAMSALEAARGGADPVPPAVARGWLQLQHSSPRFAGTLSELAHDPWPLVKSLQSTPQTFVHGDWKFGNLGEHPDGRTILLDWDRCGAAPATLDLAWYLAVNCDRLPQTKEATIDVYRRALEQRGIETAPWWKTQLSLTLLGAALQLAWSKVGDGAELGWWEDRAGEGAALLS